ncbi:MAG: endonuclease/exonuclease/phosphatase family protein [Halieaceae bacterium]|nr:endonuclease/exonuclease/phosphatase family protein [Halieaceae bacterium]
MAKILSFASWNVEHFHGRPERVARVVDLLAETRPDIFALYEVKGKDVYEDLKRAMPGHNFVITERTDSSSMEILVGVRKSLSVFITQRDEFRSRLPTMRPGIFATVTKADVEYCFLFLHLKSFDDPRSWGLRDDMFHHVARLKRALDRRGDAEPNLLVLGDLNTMGLSAAYNDVSDIDGKQELAFVANRMRRANMRRLPPSHELSWWNGSDNYAPGSSLDHVFASEHMRFRSFRSGAEIKVVGWPDEPTDEAKRAWIEAYSDHALLYGEIVS